ncbi:hypothetical protein CH373_02840 [Leptospira perolatii]|uniref:Uncharacterized protein n=1 Tax=Leptospira perolatii TaxID=2023191 RepID=A0A2M9ZSH6_9LEPT|nr:hypothetical protein CH373_02840 [Leptospira perolatii]
MIPKIHARIQMPNVSENFLRFCKLGISLRIDRLLRFTFCSPRLVRCEIQIGDRRRFSKFPGSIRITDELGKSCSWGRLLIPWNRCAVPPGASSSLNTTCLFCKNRAVDLSGLPIL